MKIIKEIKNIFKGINFITINEHLKKCTKIRTAARKRVIM